MIVTTTRNREDIMREETEGLNPSIHCNLSRRIDEPEQHAPVGFNSPHGLSSISEKKLDRDGVIEIKS
jgi:hypothetical protein